MTPPVELKTETPNLNIAPSMKRPLNLALVIPDPMAYVIFYEVPSTKYTRDLTAQYRSNGFYLERELAKVCSETFSQAFRQVAVLRDMPQQDQYDAVVQLKIGKILMLLVGDRQSGMNLPIDMTTEWSMTLLDSRNGEIFSKKGISSPQSFDVNMFVPADWSRGMGQMMSVTINQLAKEWGAILYSSETLSVPAVTGEKQ